jgi:hypothetical protein
MSILKNGGPAYPVETQSTGSQDEGEYGHQASTSTWQFPGMTLRDHFAAKALLGVCALVAADKHQPDPADAARGGAEFLAKSAYRLADAMLKAREAA